MFFVNDETAEKRMAICRQCEFFKESTAQCTKCGCFMNYKSKMKSSECPVGKWKKEE